MVIIFTKYSILIFSLLFIPLKKVLVTKALNWYQDSWVVISNLKSIHYNVFAFKIVNIGDLIEWDRSRRKTELLKDVQAG